MEHDEDHTELAKLNGGKLPYVMTNKLMRYPTIRNCVPMEILYECSGKCPAGEGCIYRPSQVKRWHLPGGKRARTTATEQRALKPLVHPFPTRPWMHSFLAAFSRSTASPAAADRFTKKPGCGLIS